VSQESRIPSNSRSLLLHIHSGRSRNWSDAQKPLMRDSFSAERGRAPLPKSYRKRPRNIGRKLTKPAGLIGCALNVSENRKQSIRMTSYFRSERRESDSATEELVSALSALKLHLSPREIFLPIGGTQPRNAALVLEFLERVIRRSLFHARSPRGCCATPGNFSLLGFAVRAAKSSLANGRTGRKVPAPGHYFSKRGDPRMRRFRG